MTELSSMKGGSKSSAKILVLPGMGDIYWVATILPQFLRQQGITEKPEIWIWDFDGRKRSLEFVERIPFVKAGGYWEHTHELPEFNELYMRAGRWWLPDFRGFDYLVSLNGILRNGLPITSTGFNPDWHFPLIQTEAEKQYKRNGEYIVTHFSEFGMFSRWVQAWGEDGVARFVDILSDRAEVLLTGCSWDAPFASRIAKRTKAVNLCAETDMDQFFGLFRGSIGCAGWCGGNTIVAAALKIPTLILWSDYFPNRGFFTNAAAPGHLSAVVENVSPDAAASMFLESLA